MLKGKQGRIVSKYTVNPCWATKKELLLGIRKEIDYINSEIKFFAEYDSDEVTQGIIENFKSRLTRVKEDYARAKEL